MATKPKTPPDWERIELDYRAGVKTLRQIGEEHGISHAAIAKRAKASSWERDLAAKIQAKADTLVTKSAVTKEVTTETNVSEREVIEANAQAIADIRLAHRRDIQQAQNIVINLMEELKHQTGVENAALLAELGEIMRQEDDKGQDKLNDLYRKIISLPERARTMKTLADSLGTVIGLQRQAFGMDKDAESVVDAFTKMLERVTSGNNSAFIPVAHDPEHED